jgi:hypothetical protein
VGCLLRKCETFSSNPSTAKKKKKRGRGRGRGKGFQRRGGERSQPDSKLFGKNYIGVYDYWGYEKVYATFKAET